MTMLAVDLGGSSLKTCLYADDGHVMARARVELGFDEPHTGWSEADPVRWWNALCSATESMVRDADAPVSSVRVVSVCAYTRTQVFLDKNLQPVRPAIAFRDCRAAEFGEVIRAQVPSDHPDMLQFNGFHPLARLLWLKQNEPESWDRVRYVIEPKDYLNLRLTGIATSDEVSLFQLAKAFEGGAKSLAARCGIDRSVVPELDRPQTLVGTVTADQDGAMRLLSGAGVVRGSNDSFTAVAGMAGLVPGRAYCVSGSSEVLGMISSHEAHAEGMITMRWGDGLWQLGGPGQNGSNTFDWANSVLRGDRDQLQQDSFPQSLIFLPFLLGERMPYWDGDLRGALLGLGTTSDSDHIRRAVLEGVAYVNRTVLERAEKATGIVPTELRIGGGGARNMVWNQIRADVLGRTVLASTEPETGLAGCLAIARTTIGEESPTDLAGSESSFRRFEPSAARHDHYNELFRLYTEAHEALTPISHQLASLARRSSAPYH